MTSSAKSPYAGYRFPGEVISHAVWLSFRFPLSLRMVEEMLAARGIDASHETVRQWARKFGQAFANQIRRRLPGPGDKWHLDEVCLMIAGQKHWLWRAERYLTPSSEDDLCLLFYASFMSAGWYEQARAPALKGITAFSTVRNSIAVETLSRLTDDKRRACIINLSEVVRLIR